MHSEIPAIDFSCFLTGSVRERQQAVSDIDHALSSVGFFYLLKHGIDQGKIDTYFEWSRRFFSLPEHEKNSLRPARRSFDQGYSGIGEEKIRGQICMKESFDFGNPRDNVLGSWPKEEQLSGFRDFATDFHQICTELVDKLLQCLSIALDLGPQEPLGQYHTGSMFVSSLIHYPAISTERLRSGEVIRNPAHSDFGTLTLLFQQKVGGLQVADMSSTDKTTSAAVARDGKFIHVDPKPGTIIVNVGYLLMRWTNGRWKSTIHRVLEPPRTSNNAAQDIDDGEEWIPERFSGAFFSFPDEATMVEPLSTCCSEQEPKKWGPVNAGEYLLKKRAVMYS